MFPDAGIIILPALQPWASLMARSVHLYICMKHFIKSFLFLLEELKQNW